METPMLIGIVLLGLLAGSLSGFFGVGGGTIIIPGMVILLLISQHVAQGVSLAVIVPTAILGTYAYSRRGYTRPKIALFLALGAVVGALIGSLIAGLIPEIELRKLFGVFILLLGLKMGVGK